jgi:peptide/nickel transport system permease protein
MVKNSEAPPVVARARRNSIPSVLRLFIRKLVQGAIMLLVVSAITFGLLSSAGGDALSALRENPQVSEETIAQLREVYGLDRPVTERYAKWLIGLVRGEMGESIAFRTGVAGLIASRLGNTAQLGFLALGIAILVSFVLAFVSIRSERPSIGRVIDFIVLITASTPRIVLALFALSLTVWVSGSVVAIRSGSVAAMLLAAVVLAFPVIALFLAQLHSGLKQAMAEPFVQFARSKGLSENAVIIRHASRAALNPLLTIFGLSLGGLIGGSVIVETILGWPGIGALTVSAVRSRDVPLVMGIVVVTSAAVWLGNSMAEALQFVNDKRLRTSETE